MTQFALPILCLIVGTTSWAGCAALRRFLPHWGAVDIPSARSNHAAPTPRGGGVAVTIAILAALLFLAPLSYLPIGLGMALLTAVGFVDDRRHLPVWARLVAQLLALGVGVLAMAGVMLLFVAGGTPLYWPIFVAMALFGLWWINTYNFMDGIDGIAALHSCAIGLGMVAVWHGSGGRLPEPLVVAGLVMACAAVGFWLHNRHPAGLFLGDSGSLPLGLLTLWLLVSLFILGWWPAMLILPAYYVVDGGVTLAARVLRRERWWEAHSQHAYQRAARRGLSHDAVVLRLLGLNVALIALAWLATVQAAPSWLCVAAAYLAALGLWMHLKGGGRAAAAA